MSMHTNPTSCQKCRSTSHQSFVHHRRFYYLRKFLPFLQTSMLKCWFLSEQTALSGFRCIKTLYIDNIPFIEQLFVFAMHNSVALPCSFFSSEIRSFVHHRRVYYLRKILPFLQTSMLKCWFLSEQTALSGFRCIETLYIDNIHLLNNFLSLPCTIL